MRKSIGTIVLFILVLLCLAGCASQSEASEEMPVILEETASDTEQATAEAEVSPEEKVLPSTVCITAGENGYGTGFAIEEGRILTSYHVVWEAPDEITLLTYEGTEYSAELIAFNAEADIAVLKYDGSLEPVVFADPDLVEEEEPLTAIGNPSGDLSFSMVPGKAVVLSEELRDKFDKDRQYIFYDGDAVSGYSGGPVFDKNGAVVGILYGRYSADLSSYGYDNLCVIIPIDRALAVAEEILRSENA